jgi:tRNA (cytidine56-2'-O)-methyltransferase
MIEVLRLGYRLVRDARTSTHLALVARAFGADAIWFTELEPEVERSLAKVGTKWGGAFKVREVENWRGLLEKWKNGGGAVVHLTMYGLPVDSVLESIRSRAVDLLIVVGSSKIPREVFKLSDHNVAIGHQPHSEVAALAVFLDRWLAGEGLKRQFPDYIVRVSPSERGQVIEEF